jgi:hypothetical protein
LDAACPEQSTRGIVTKIIRPSELQSGVSQRQKKFIKAGLTRAGFGSLREYYLESAQWRAVKARYRRSRLPQKCVVCFDPNVDLHHRTYKRLGAERLTDLEPLCREHHDQLHTLEHEWRTGGVDPGGVNLWTASKIITQHQTTSR